jgi:SAM-dependent methyltransferase
VLDTEQDLAATKLLVSQCGGDPGPVVRRLMAHDSRVGRKIIRKLQKRSGRASFGALREVLYRRTWSLHRLVHLVAAFEQVHAEAPLTTVLTAGCGAGLAELYLAARHPEVQFTLTDFDADRLVAARRTAENLGGLPNVRFRTLDLLAEPSGERFDLVTSTEVLEHIEADEVAARHMAALASRAVWALVPFCPARDLDRPDLQQRAWEAHGHHRIGYTAESLAALFPDDGHEWVRNCYYEPEASDLRTHLKESDNRQLLQQYPELVTAAVTDVRDEPRPDGGAAGIEILVRRDR